MDRLTAREIALIVQKDLDSRQGFCWECTDTNTQEEILETWTNLIVDFVGEDIPLAGFCG